MTGPAVRVPVVPGGPETVRPGRPADPAPATLPAGSDGPAMIDLRCPDGMAKLLGRTAASTRADGVIELACNNCARNYRRAGLPCSRVLHRFNLLGELLATEVTP